MGEVGLWLYGASGHARVIIDILERAGKTIEGLIDDNEAILELDNYKVVRSGMPLKHLIISIGNNRIRRKIAEAHGDAIFELAIHPDASIARRTELGAGTVVMAQAAINPGSRLGRHVILNTNASVDHDCEIGDFVHISPNAALCGNVILGEGTHIGAGAVIIPGITIGRWCTVGAGAVVIRNVPDFATVVGNPGRIIKIDNHE